jgi:biotin carboxyl carrier protein
MTELTIASPLPGTFYRRPSPEAAPYVGEGDSIEEGTVVGIIEIMKTFYDVPSEHAGVLERFLVEDASLVDAGDPIAVVRG